jgi:hypothetical protein
MPRVQRICGIRVPIFDEPKLGTGAVTIRFVLEGLLISKKNNESAIPDAKNAKDYLYQLNKANGGVTLKDALEALARVRVRFVGNPKYRACKKRFIPVIQAQMEQWEPLLAQHGVKFPLQEAVLSVKLAFKDKYRTDTINKMQTIHDLLVEAGAISDDDYTVLNPIKGYSKLFNKRLTENVALISLTIKNEKIKSEDQAKEKIK